MYKILNSYNPISLEETQRAQLMKRVDSKFLVTHNILQNVLSQCSDYYDILQINNERNLSYKTYYYDTPDFQMYTNHHNGKKNRYKIRFRKYVETDTNFLEIKFKNNKSETIKKRVPADETYFSYSEKDYKFIRKNSTYILDNLELKSTNQFNRITLVHKKNVERVTIDNNIIFSSKDGKEIILKNISIIEIKQEKFSLNSEIMQFIKNNHIREFSLSKYCTATSLLNPHLKCNNFKQKLTIINKLIN